MPTFFDPLKVSPFAPHAMTISSVLTAGLRGHGSVTIRASKKGISIHLGGKLLCRGKTPDELHENFKLMQAKAFDSATKPA